MAIKIMLDPGHFTNFNRSPVFSPYYEGNMTWKLTNYLKNELKLYGFEVAMTKSSSASDLAVYDRGYKAKGYDLFLSIHSNACDTQSVDRVVVIRQLNRNNGFAEKLADCITKTMGVKQAYQAYTKSNSSGGEYYGVLRGSAAARVEGYIIEHSFHTNADAARWLYSDDNLKKLAIAEAKVIADRYGYKKTEQKPTVPSTSYIVKITTPVLNIRSGPAMSFDIVGKVLENEAYTIVDEQNDFLKLKSGAGWISKVYTKRL